MDFLATPRRRRLLFAALYLSEGAPIGFVWWALPTRLRAAGMPVETITWLTAVLVLPWALKFLWAPLIDVLRGPAWSFRHWIAAAQLAMGAALVPLFWLELEADFAVVAVLLLLHAVAAATQDVAIDALTIAAAPADERGRINGWMQVGMLLGRAVMGGGALWLSARFGDSVVFGLLLAMIWTPMLLLAGSRGPSGEPPRPTPGEAHPLARRTTSFGRQIGRALQSRNTWLGLLFAGTAGAAFEAVGAVAGPFLIDRGLSQDEVGMFYLLPVIAATSAGALIGGACSDRLGRKRAVIAAQGVVVAAVLGIAAIDAAAAEPARPLLVGALSGLYFGVGLFTAASYALLMDLAAGGVAATQFSAFMGATNGCEAWAAYAVGRLIAEFGYPPAFCAMAAVSVLALAVLAKLDGNWGSHGPANRKELSGPES